MLAKCSPEIFQFFNPILDAADDQGHTIYWGIAGFSIRVYIPSSESFASITYGYPPNILQIYFAHLPFLDEQIVALRKELLEFGILKRLQRHLVQIWSLKTSK